VIKTLPIVLALGLAAASATALADPSDSMSGSHMQNCITKEKAKNDGRSDADISSACATKTQQKQQSQPNSTDGMTPGNGPAPSSQTPTTPNEPTQTPK
jgi:hypothetical protein